MTAHRHGSAEAIEEDKDRNRPFVEGQVENVDSIVGRRFRSRAYLEVSLGARFIDYKQRIGPLTESQWNLIRKTNILLGRCQALFRLRQTGPLSCCCCCCWE